jgi:hypothetical protein
MKTAITLALISLLAACGTGHQPPHEQYPRQTMYMDKEVEPMSRNEVIVAIKECESSGLRAVMVYSKRKISGHTADVVADVTCAPLFVY